MDHSLNIYFCLYSKILLRERGLSGSMLFQNILFAVNTIFRPLDFVHFIFNRFFNNRILWGRPPNNLEFFGYRSEFGPRFVPSRV